MLGLTGGGRRVERLLSARLGASRPSAAEIAGGASFRAPRHAVFAFCEELAREAGDPYLGVKSASCRRGRTLCELASVTARNLGEGLAVGARLVRLQNDNPVEIAGRTESIVYRQHLGSGTARHFAESVAAFLVAAIRACVGEIWSPLEVRFPHRRPRRIAVLEDALRCPVRFEAAAIEIEIARDDLALPSRRSDPDLHALLTQLALEQLARVVPAPAPRVEDQVRTFLLEEIPRGVTLESVAAHLRTTVRTLQRRLDEEGTTYFAVLDDARRELATRLLSDPARKGVDVALEVGFQDVSSFHRAFQRWTRETPGQFRKKLRGRARR
jgi:AraC-like DNA-binding protein